MTVAASLLCLAALLPSPQGELKLPPKKASATPQPTQRPMTEIERFRRDLQLMHSSPSQIESRLLEMGSAYPALEPLIVEVARSARANEMGNLMIVARRFGTPRVADELLFQLLARPLGEATRATVEAMVQLKGADSKQALKECIRGRISSAQRHATDVLMTLVGPEDLQFALELSGEQNLDLQLRGVDLLRAVPGERSVQRLIELLSKEPTVAAAACGALVQLGTNVIAPLQTLCTAPPIDRSFDYGAFALAQIERANGGALLPATMVPVLGARVTQRDLLTRCLDAIALSDLAFRTLPGSGETFPDAAVVDALLEVVQPTQFVPNLDMLRRPAEERLVRTTGRVVVGTQVLTWREWWKDQRETFVGMRASVSIDEKTAGNAVVVWRHEQRYLRLLGENRAAMAPVEGALEIVLTSAQMLELVSTLKQKGFGNLDLMRVESGLPLVRQLQIQVAGGRAQMSMPASEQPAFEELVHIVQQQVDGELWQLYRNPADEPDRAAFWRTERRWREANPDATEIGRRFARRIVQNWHVLSPGLRLRGIEYLLDHSNRRQLLLEEDGERILAAVAKQNELGELELRLLELAAAVPGDRVWRQCVDLAARSKGGGRNAVRAVFAVLGPEAVLSALHDDNPVVRRSAVEEVVVVRDHRAGPRLVELLSDVDAEVRRAAASACGSLQVAAASNALIAAIAAEDTPVPMRRECLRALGRVGGDQAFPVLQRALTATEQEDKEAALRGIGELHDPRAAHLLAELAVVAHGKDLGALARYYLQRMGGILVVPAIRAQMQTVQDQAIKDHLVLVLGAYQDPTVVPNLMDLLRNDTQAAAASALIEGTTGIDLSTSSDRIGAIEAWWRKNRTVPQWQWLLDALKAANVPTVLTADNFGPGAGLAPVPELARLLIECKEPRLWVLSSAVLRTVTSEDFGVVTPSSAIDVREGIAARYRMLTETARAAQGR